MRALSFDDISLVPRYNNIESRRDVDTGTEFGNLYLSSPVFSSNMDTITGVDMAIAIGDAGGLGTLHRFCSIEENVDMYSLVEARGYDVVVSLGVNEGLDRFDALYNAGARYFCIDIAHGHSSAVGDMIGDIRLAASQGDAFIIAGNVCHAAGAEYLVDRGADAVKVGIGPGSVCSTRVKTGFGVPQFTAIQDCSRVNAFLIADGGIRTPGDVVKALYGGADAVMIGGMLSGTDETPGELVDGKKVFRGMASKEAQDDFMGQMNNWKTAEGVEVRVKAKGPVAGVIQDIMGGVRSGMTYCGANNLRQIRERASHVEVTAAGRLEGTPHGKSDSI